MKKLWLLCVCILFACSNKNNNEIIIGGSTSMQPLMEALAETYNKTNSSKVSVQGGGSSVGISGVNNNTFTLGMVSRELKENEKETLEETPIAKEAIVVVVNKENTINNLSIKQLKDIYTGKITNWKEVGGDNLEIAVISREEGSGTRDGFESVVGFKSIDQIRNAEIQNSAGAIITNIKGNKNAIGYISLGLVNEYIKVLSIDHIEANENTIRNNTYKIQRPFILVSKKNTDHKIIDFIYSDEGKKIIEENKYIAIERGNNENR